MTEWKLENKLTENQKQELIQEVEKLRRHNFFSDVFRNRPDEKKTTLVNDELKKMTHLLAGVNPELFDELVEKRFYDLYSFEVKNIIWKTNPDEFIDTMKKLIIDNELGIGMYQGGRCLKHVAKIDQELYEKLYNIGLNEDDDDVRYEFALSLEGMIEVDKDKYLDLLRKGINRKMKKRWVENNKNPKPYFDDFVAQGTIESARSLPKIDKQLYLQLYEETWNHKRSEIRLGIANSLPALAEIDPKKYVALLVKSFYNDKQTRDRYGFNLGVEILTNNAEAIHKINPYLFEMMYKEAMDFADDIEKKRLYNYLNLIADTDPEYFKDYLISGVRSSLGFEIVFELMDHLHILPSIDLELYYELFQEAKFQNLDDKTWDHIRKKVVNSLSGLAKSKPHDFLDLLKKKLDAYSPDRLNFVASLDLQDLVPALDSLADVSTPTFKKYFKKAVESYTRDIGEEVLKPLEKLGSFDSKEYLRYFHFLLNSEKFNEKNKEAKTKLFGTIGGLAKNSFDTYMKLFNQGYSDADNLVKVAVLQTLPGVVEQKAGEPFSITRDYFYDFVNAYLSSVYVYEKDRSLMDKQKIIGKISEFIGLDPKEIKNLTRIVQEGKARNLDEALECSRIHLANYVVLKKLGEGAIKTVYLGKNIHSGHESALLMIDPNSKGFAHYKNIHKNLSFDELKKKIYEQEFSGAKLRDLENPSYIGQPSPPIQGKNVKGQKAFFMETKKYENTLEDVLKSGMLMYEEALTLMGQMAIALMNCHKNGIVHKDLKEDNIGINEFGHVVMSDFGCTHIFSHNIDSRYQYPLHLRPPELAHGDDYWNKKGVIWQSDLFTPEANIWTLGAIGYRMFAGKYLFDRPKKRAPVGSLEWHAQNEEVYRQIRNFENSGKNKQVFDEIKNFAGDEARFLLQSCLEYDPEKRSFALEKIIKVYKDVILKE